MSKFATSPNPPLHVAPDPPPIPQPSPADPPPEPVFMWNEDLAAAPRDGRLVVLTENVANRDGVLAVWYMNRGSARPCVLTENVANRDGVLAVWYMNRGSARPWAKPREGWMGVEPRVWVGFEPAGWANP